jgi:hypothetical protein
VLDWIDKLESIVWAYSPIAQSLIPLPLAS